jgi:ABC-type phosphate/phosphonate transport system ATPase subunit
MLHGRVVFDGLPDELTEATVRRVYGVEADEVLSETVTSTALPAAAN